MKCYLAAAYTRRAELRRYAEELEQLGHTCTASWLHAQTLSVTDDGRTLAGEEPVLRALARQDRLDIRASDVLIGFTEPLDVWIRGGTEREIGYADGLGKGLILIGERRTIFDWLPGLCRFDTWTECAAFLRAMREEGKALGVSR